jgi:hypothetical protein
MVLTLTRTLKIRHVLNFRHVAATAAAVCLPLGIAQAAPAATATSSDTLSVELNKLETYDRGCRAYVVINNVSDHSYQSVKLDLVLFQPDGVIARRFAVDLAPLKSTKKTVKLFDMEGLACEKIASILVNDVMDCKIETGPIADCLSKMNMSSVAAAPLTK